MSAIFIHQAVADTPSWMHARHPLSVPDVLIPVRDPAERRQLEERAETWSGLAECERDQTIRLWLLEDRALGGPVQRRWHIQCTPAAAWWWFHTTTVASGHRLVLTEEKP